MGNRPRGHWKVPPSAAFEAEHTTVRSVRRRTGGFAHGSILGFGLDVAGNVAQGSPVLNPGVLGLGFRHGCLARSVGDGLVPSRIGRTTTRFGARATTRVAPTGEPAALVGRRRGRACPVPRWTNNDPVPNAGDHKGRPYGEAPALVGGVGDGLVASRGGRTATRFGARATTRVAPAGEPRRLPGGVGDGLVPSRGGRAATRFRTRATTRVAPTGKPRRLSGGVGDGLVPSRGGRAATRFRTRATTRVAPTGEPRRLSMA